GAGGVGAPCGGATFGYFADVAVRPADTDLLFSPAAVGSPAASAAPSGASRQGVGSQLPSTSLRCVHQPRASTARPTMAHRIRPSAPVSCADQPMRMPNQPKSASPKVVLASPKVPSTPSKKAGKIVMISPLANAPSIAPRRPPVALP